MCWILQKIKQLYVHRHFHRRTNIKTSNNTVHFHPFRGFKYIDCSNPHRVHNSFYFKITPWKSKGEWQKCRSTSTTTSIELVCLYWLSECAGFLNLLFGSNHYSFVSCCLETITRDAQTGVRNQPDKRWNQPTAIFVDGAWNQDRILAHNSTGTSRPEHGKCQCKHSVKCLHITQFTPYFWLATWKPGNHSSD